MGNLCETMARITLMLLSLTLCAVLVVAAPTRELSNEEDLLESVSLLDTQEKASRHYTSQDWDGDSFHGQQESFGTKQAAARDRKKAVAKANLIFDDAAMSTAAIEGMLKKVEAAAD